MTIYHYSKCSTCRNALKWLDAHGVKYEKKDIVSETPSRRELERVFKAAGVPIKKLFNTSGESYKTGDFKNKLATMTDAQALDALAHDGKLIKRPLIVSDTQVLIGFDPEEYKAALAG